MIAFSVFSSTAPANPAKKNHVEAELFSEFLTIEPGSSFWAGIRLKMDPKWHTYWRNPGDAGLATKIEWILPNGFKPGPIQWPIPQRFNDSGIISHGYQDEVILLSKIEVETSVNPNQNIQLQAKVNWLACKKICLPGGADLKLNMPVRNEKPEIDSRWSKAVSETRAKLPQKTTDWRFTANLKDSHTIELFAIPPKILPDNLGNVVFFPEKDIPIKLDSPQSWTPLEHKYRLVLKLLPEMERTPTHLSGLLVNDKGWRGLQMQEAIRIDVKLREEIIGIPSDRLSNTTTNISLIAALVFAFIGGLILNLMPCVFPVISLKVLGFVNHAQGDAKAAWKHGLVFAAGVLVSFWILAAVLLSIRAGGTQIGWGFQLQSPTFVTFLAILMFLLALNLFGVFEIGLSLTRTGSVLVGKKGWIESFLSGVLATIVATPCTAPFMGAALGFALSQPPAMSIGIFTFLGLGMAFPYVLLSRFQSLVKFIPRPGSWMETFKKFMGFLIMATVVWLLWLLQILDGPGTLINLLTGFLIIALGAWVYGTWCTPSRKIGVRFAAIITALIILAAGVAYPVSRLSKNKIEVKPAYEASKKKGGIQWQDFTAEKVSRLLSEGHRVFIDFTAAWCLSCLANERVAFSSKEVQKRFEDLNIVPIKADWTHRNEEITRELAKYGRSGVPFYILYDGNENSDPLILPEILTPGIVLNALNKLEKSNENIRETDI